jgi:hypothetical protein
MTGPLASGAAVLCIAGSPMARRMRLHLSATRWKLKNLTGTKKSISKGAAMLGGLMIFNNMVDPNNPNGVVDISCTVDLSYSKPNVLIQFLVHSKDKAGVETILPFNLTWADTNVLFGFVNNVLNSNPNS